MQRANANKKAEAKKTRAESGRLATPLATASTTTLGKDACACGGGCPRCAKRVPVQPKLAVSRPADPLEQEADEIADEILRSPPASSDDAPPHAARSSRTSSARPSTVGSTAIEENLLATPGDGRPLDTATKDFFESRFHHDFASVRVHTDPQAALAARRMNAFAFTRGTDIYFGAGRYQPGGIEGRRLLAHELTHTIQQDGQAPPPGVAHAGQASAPSHATPEVGPRISRAPQGNATIMRDGPGGEITPADLGIDPRTFAQLWEEFDRHRWTGHDDEALALVPTLIVRMSTDEAIDHAGDLALWLIRHDARELALRALDQLQSAWWIRYVSTSAPAVPAWVIGGFGTSVGPENLVAQAETEAQADHHDTAHALLGVAHLMTQILLARVYAQRARDEAAAEAMGEEGEVLLSMTGIMLQGDYEQLIALRTRILNVYPHLAAQARASGDRDRAASLAHEGQTLHDEIVARFTLSDLPDSGDLSAPVGPPPPATARAARPRASATARTDTGAADTATATTDTTATTPTTEPARAPGPDRIVESPPPFNGATTLDLHGNHYVKVSSERYAVSEVLSRAVTWARNLFGVMSSVVVMHGDEDGVIRYYAAALDEDLTETFPAANPLQPVMIDVAVRLESLPNEYHIMVIHVGNGAAFWPSPERAQAFNLITSREYRAGPQITAVDRALIQTNVFAPIDALMENEEENRQEIARRLAQLDATAFSTLTTEKRSQYLNVLLRAWTWQAQERAVVEIMKSVTSQTELNAIIQRLKDDELWEQLIDDLDNELWSLLVAVGERFGAQQLTVLEVYQMMADEGLLQIGTPVPGLSIGPNGPEFNADVLGEIEEACNSFLRFVEGMWDGIVMLVTHPDKIVEGLAQLVKMSLVFQLADLGYPPAIVMRAQILGQIGQQLLNGFKGLSVLHVGREVIRRVKWAIIWEIASFFIGIGEIKAAMEAMGASARVGAIARFLRLLGLLGEVAEAEEATGALTRLARILGRSSRVLRTEEEVLVALSHLPEEEATRLGRALEGLELNEGMTLAQLRAAHPELGELAEASLRRAEVVHQLAAKSGGFTDEVVRCFGRLSEGGHTTEDLARIVAHIPEGEGGRFAHAIGMIPEDVSLAGERALGSLESIAQSTTRMQAVERFGFRAFDSALVRAGGNGALVDEYMSALVRIEQNMPAATRATEIQALVEALERGESGALFRVENEIRDAGGAGAQALRSRLSATTHSWSAGFPTRPPAGGRPAASAFQRKYCGPVETQVTGGGQQVWADGLIPEEGMLRDAKLTENPARSPFVDANPHPIPQFVLDQIRDSIDDEMIRYAAVINDPTTPVVGLEIVTNEAASVPFWERMLRTHGIPGRVVVRPP